MTVSRDGRGGNLYFECDAQGGCPNVCETHVRNFDDAIIILKEEGWTSRQENGKWKHFCPDEEDLEWLK